MRIKKLLVRSVKGWLNDNAARLGAALAYYTVFSIGPFLVILIALASIFFEQEAVEGRVFSGLKGLMGAEGAKTVQDMIAGAGRENRSITAAIVGGIFLLIGASGIFGQLEDALNTIWRVKAKAASGVWDFIRGRFMSFAIVLSMGFLFIVSLTLSTVVTAVTTSVYSFLPGSDLLIMATDLVFSFAVTTVVFACLFRFLPDADVPWDDAVKGGAFTTALFFIGKVLMGVYIGKSDFASTYGIAASAIILLVWVYYSAQIFLLGAEFTKLLGKAAGEEPTPV